MKIFADMKISSSAKIHIYICDAADLSLTNVIEKTLSHLSHGHVVIMVIIMVIYYGHRVHHGDHDHQYPQMPESHHNSLQKVSSLTRDTSEKSVIALTESVSK